MIKDVAKTEDVTLLRDIQELNKKTADYNDKRATNHHFNMSTNVAATMFSDTATHTQTHSAVSMIKWSQK